MPDLKIKKLAEKLEDLVDANNLVDVINALSQVCHEKAQHIEENWQDKRLAKTWETAARKLDRLFL